MAARRNTANSAGGGPRKSRTQSSDSIVMLRDEHREVERLFKEFERTKEGALKSRRRLVDRMILLLTQHAAVEEQVFYPSVRREVRGATSDVLESLEEHHIVKWELSELEKLDPEDERFNAKVTVMMENVRHHVEEEEGDLFPLVRSELGRKRLGELGDEMKTAKRHAPAHPHPRSPDEPPGNLLAGPVAGMVDGVVDKARELVKNARPGA